MNKLSLKVRHFNPRLVLKSRVYVVEIDFDMPFSFSESFSSQYI